MPADFFTWKPTLQGRRIRVLREKGGGELKSSFSCVQHQDFPSLLQIFFFASDAVRQMCDVDATSLSNSQYATEAVELNFAMLTRMHLEYPITFLTMQFEAV